MAVNIIAGTGSFLPATVISNQEIYDLAREKSPEWIEATLGVSERRLQLSPELLTGDASGLISETEMAAIASERALESARLRAEDIDGIWYVSCTQPDQRQHFSRSVMELHRRLGLRADALALEMDAGCGGAVQVLGASNALLKGSDMKTMLVVGSNSPSHHYTNWHEYVLSGAWLSMYLFGDGAGALVLKKDNSTSSADRGIIASHHEVDPTEELMFFRSKRDGGGPVYEIDARTVKKRFPDFMLRAIDGLRSKRPFGLLDVARFYFHQVNGVLLRSFAEKLQVPWDRVAHHVEKYGNLSAPATLVLLDEDIREGRVKKGDLCLFCTVGAGTQRGAALVRL